MSSSSRILPNKRLKYTIICFQIGKGGNALDLISNRLIHRELLMVTNIVHSPSGHNYIKKDNHHLM